MAILASTERFQAYGFQWVSGSTGNVCTVQDAAGVTRWEAVAAATNAVVAFTLPDECELNFNGLKVPNLDSGKVYIYVKRT